MSKEIKERLLEACRMYVDKRIGQIDMAIRDLQDALKLETKCSMGDKYETGRAMLHLEFEKLSVQHERYLKLKKTVGMMDSRTSLQKASFGAVVETQHANYFIAIPAGEIVLDEGRYYAVGAGAPIAQALEGKMEKEKVMFNGNELIIKRIF